MGWEKCYHNSVQDQRGSEVKEEGIIVKTILLTLIIEIPVLLLFGFRKKDIITVGIFINIATNFSINLLMYRIKYVIASPNYGSWIFPLEVAVVLVEFIAMSFFTDKKIKLFFVVALANILSYLSGILLFGSY